MEYCFAFLKTDYKKNNDFCTRTLQKRIKESFERVVTVEAIRLCCRRANEYMRAYIKLDAQGDGDLMKGEIERVKSEHKCHRCALDFDRGWAKKMVTDLLAARVVAARVAAAPL